MRRLRKRAEFVGAASGRRYSTPYFTLQARAHGRDDVAEPGFGFTVTRKTGGAVERNRIRRRLKEAVRLGPLAATPLAAGPLTARPLAALPGYDYVLIGRRAALNGPFEAILKDLDRALRAVHRDATHRDAKRDGQARGPIPPERTAVSDHTDD
jgi:ribonuclease P protein component